MIAKTVLLVALLLPVVVLAAGDGGNLEKARAECAKGLPKACLDAGLALTKAPRQSPPRPQSELVLKLYREATRLFAEQCENGNGDACYELGVMYKYGESVEPSRLSAAYHYQRGCDLGSAVACESLGLMYYEGGFLQKDPVRAGKAFDRGCSLKGARSCFLLGQMHDEKMLTHSSTVEGKRLRTLACQLGMQGACIDSR